MTFASTSAKNVVLTARNFPMDVNRFQVLDAKGVLARTAFVIRTLSAAMCSGMASAWTNAAMTVGKIAIHRQLLFVAMGPVTSTKTAPCAPRTAEPARKPWYESSTWRQK